MKLKSLSCVLLAYHEEAVIEKTIREAAAVLNEAADLYEIIIVGFEGCKDKTNQIVQALGEKDSRIRLVVQKREEKGYGRAFALGIKSTRYDWIIQSDADGQYAFSELTKMLPFTSNPKIGMIHGYRAPRRDPFERVVFAGMYNTALKIIYHVPIKDIDSAFKLIRGDVAREIQLEALTGFAITEFVMRIKAKGFQFIQMPIKHLPRETGEALAEKGVANPLGMELPNPHLVKSTLSEMWKMRDRLKRLS